METNCDNMENSLVPMMLNELYITNAAFQGCFIKIWATFYSTKRKNLENTVQDYKNYSKEFNKLDLSGNTLYIYVWQTAICEERVYRCQVLGSDLVAKTLTIMLIDYGQTMVVPYNHVREVTVGTLDQRLLNTLYQRATVHTFLLSTYLSKRKSVNELNEILCDKYYKFQKDFEVGGVTFVSIYDIDKKLVDSGLADTINVTNMSSIANSMSSIIMSNNKMDLLNNSAIPCKASTLYSNLRHQKLDYVTLINVVVTRVSAQNDLIILTIRVLDTESTVLKSLLDSLDRHNLKLLPTLDVHTPCLIVFCNELVRAIILEVKIESLYIYLVDYGIKKYVPRTSVFEIPSNCYLIEMRSMNVVLNKPNYITIDKSMFSQKCFHMLPLKMDPSFGLYKVKLFIKQNNDLVDIFDSLNNMYMDTTINEQCPIPYNKLTAFAITELNQEEIQCVYNFMANNLEVVLDNVTHDQNENKVQKAKETISLKKTEYLDLKAKENVVSEEKENNLKNNDQNENKVLKTKETMSLKEIEYLDLNAKENVVSEEKENYLKNNNQNETNSLEETNLDSKVNENVIFREEDLKNNDQNENKVSKLKENICLKETENLDLKMKKSVEPKEKDSKYNNQVENNSLKETRNLDSKVEEHLMFKEIENKLKKIIPIMFLRRENIKTEQEIIASLINYKSPLNFRVRQYNTNFEILMNKIKSTINLRYILNKNDLVKHMYVIYQNPSDTIHRAQIIDMDSEIEKIRLLLVDEGNEVINEMFNKITLYNFIESDCNLPAQLVLDCALNNMWFPSLNVDTSLMLQPYFDKNILYKVIIIKPDESGTQLVQMIQIDTDIDISETILASGFGQRLCTAMKTDENPYEEILLKGQSFLSYVIDYNFKLCIQPEPNTVDELEEEILEHINNDSNLDFNHLQQDTYCLATINNDQWYRALIISLNKSVIVNLFDIGLMTEVSLDQIRPITNNLMKKPQLCLCCYLETNEVNIKITEKILYNVTVKSIDASGKLRVSIKEHNTTPLSNPVVRGIELISIVHVDGDLTYLQRSQDKMKVEKMSETLSKLNNKVDSKPSVIHCGSICFFESHGQYYRCLVKSIFSKMAVVHCIDFGYEKQVEKKKLQCLKQSKIALVPALTITVKTFPMASNMSQTMFMANMSVEDDGTLICLPNKMTSIQTQDKLIETLKNGCLVKVTCVNSTHDCWIVPQLYFDRLETISNLLVKMQSQIIPVVTEVGSLCAALHSNTKEWYRALILGEDRETRNMLSIDSGELFKALKTTRLVSQVQIIPNCALHCRVVSNVDVKKLSDKIVKCKLISCTQPLLEVELFSEDLDETEDASTDSSVTEWIVTVSQFKSFDEFYVQKINDEFCLNDASINEQLTSISDDLEDFPQQPPAGTVVAALTDREDNVWYKAEVLTDNDNTSIIVRLFIDGSICKSTKIKVLPAKFLNEKVFYKCCLEEIVDSDINDPMNLPIVSDVMMMSKWKMITSSVEEPYKVSLTCDGKDCIDILCSVLHSENSKSSVNDELSIKEINIDEYNNMPVHKSSNLVVENPKNDFVIPDVETVTINYILTFRYFYAFSETLSILYMERILNDLDVCIVELTTNEDLIGSIVVTFSSNAGCWCRAKVDKILPDSVGAHCYLVDYGTFEDCEVFYKPTHFLQTCPPLVRRCSLYTPMLDGKEKEIWFPNISDMFKDIVNIDIANGIKFDMTIKVDGDPCLVSLQLEGSDIADMLNPMYIQLSNVKSLTDFKATSISDEQQAMVKFLKSNNIGPMILEENPIVDNIYLTKIGSNIKRVQFSAMYSTKYSVVDIDDTLDVLTVDSLYQVPETIRSNSVYTMPCSLMIHDEIETYSLSKFQKLADAKLTFIMCIITESDGTTPNLIKLYLNNQYVLDFIKS